MTDPVASLKFDAAAFGALCRTRRKARRQTLTFVGKHIGVSPSTLSNLERGAGAGNEPFMPSTDTGLKMALYYGIDPFDYLR